MKISVIKKKMTVIFSLKESFLANRPVEQYLCSSCYKKEEKRKGEEKGEERGKMFLFVALCYFTPIRRCAVEPERSEGEARSAGNHAVFFSCHGSRKNYAITVTQNLCQFERTTMFIGRAL